MPGWWNGRHEGLRSLCRKVCRFESCPGHQLEISRRDTSRRASGEFPGSHRFQDRFVENLNFDRLGDVSVETGGESVGNIFLLTESGECNRVKVAPLFQIPDDIAAI